MLKYCFAFLLLISSLGALDLNFPLTTTVKSAEKFGEIPTIVADACAYLKNHQEDGSVTRFILVRHGQSTSNNAKSIAGRTIDADLTDKGMEQADRRGDDLYATGITFDKVFSSPLVRTTKTAQLILSKFQGSQLNINYDERLHERWYGPYEGADERTFAPIRYKETHEVAKLANFSEKFAFKAHPEAESQLEVYTRTVQFITDKARAFKGQNILVLSHNWNLKSLFTADAAMSGYDVEYRSFELGNCAIVIVEVDVQGELKVMATQGLKFH